MKSNTSAPNYHPECQLISRSQELRRLALIRGWEARGGHMSTNRGPRVQRHTNAPVHIQLPLSSRALASGGATTQLGLPTAPRTQSPHSLGYSKRNLESDTDTPIRSLDTGPSFHPHSGPCPEHLRVLKVSFIFKDNTSTFFPTSSLASARVCFCRSSI